jgi:putative membrane protein
MRETFEIRRSWIWVSGVAIASLLSATGVLAAGTAAAAEALGKLHQANVKEIAMGKLAKKNGDSREVKAYGDVLVKDHTAADKKVMALARQEKVELPAATHQMSDDMSKLTGPDFDARFAKDMLDDHKRDIDEVTKARDATDDSRLRNLLSELLPTLRKHEDIAQKLVDAKATAARN